MFCFFFLIEKRNANREKNEDSTQTIILQNTQDNNKARIEKQLELLRIRIVFEFLHEISMKLCLLFYLFLAPIIKTRRR